MESVVLSLLPSVSFAYFCHYKVAKNKKKTNERTNFRFWPALHLFFYFFHFFVVIWGIHTQHLVGALFFEMREKLVVRFGWCADINCSRIFAGFTMC